MAKNQVFAPSRTRTLPVAADTVSGAPVLVGGLVGVTLTAEGEGNNAAGYATVALDGAWDLAVATTTALTVGAKVYITPALAVTTTDNSGANALFGYALEPKGTTAGQVISIELAQV